MCNVWKLRFIIVSCKSFESFQFVSLFEAVTDVAWYEVGWMDGWAVRRSSSSSRQWTLVKPCFVLVDTGSGGPCW